YRARLADAYRSLGTNPGLAVREAERVLQEAIRLDREAAAESPEDPRFRFALAVDPYDLGFVLGGAARRGEAGASCRGALTLDRPGDETPAPSRRWALVADAYCQLGKTLFGTGRAGDAEAALRRALALSEKHSDEDPDAGEYWAN